MKLKQYQIDAFTSLPFHGNPAAVCPLETWLDDSLLQAIAQENNLSETAFFVPIQTGFELRWFTPIAEVNLCGHATLATAYVIFEILEYAKPCIHFETRSGSLTVEKNGDFLSMNFPAIIAKPCFAHDLLIKGLGQLPIEILAADDYVAVFENEAAIHTLTPDLALLKQLDLRGVIITAPGDKVDFVSRFFAPKLGIPEDPVTGSAHCELMPYWSHKLGKSKLQAKQVSLRGGDLYCELKGDRVTLSGCACLFMQAEITF